MQGELLLKNSKTRLMLDLLLSCILVAMKEEKKALPLCAIERGRMSFSSMVIYVQNLGVIVLSL